MSDDKNISRFWLEDESEVIVRRFGRSWLESEIGDGKQLSANDLDELMTEEEFLKKTKQID